MIAALTGWQWAALGLCAVTVIALVGLQIIIAREQSRQELRRMLPPQRRWRPARSTVVLLIVTAALVAVYLNWSNLSPALARLLPEPTPTSAPVAAAAFVTRNSAPTPTPLPVAPTATPRPRPTATPVPYTTPEFAAPFPLPEIYNQVTPTGEPARDTALSNVQFSAEITDDYQPVRATTVFPTGSTTVYATFRHDNMVDGTAWSWVWGFDGEVLAGGNARWLFGRNGTGYVTLSPGSVLPDGRYDLTLWVNGALFTSETFYVGPPPATPTPVGAVAVTTTVTGTIPIGPVGTEAAALVGGAAVSDLAFATAINAGYAPIAPADAFPSGTPRIFGTFQHREMVAGAEWSWVWRLNGTPLDSGAEAWSYAPDGYGYVVLTSSDGLQPGAYTLEIRLSGVLLAQSRFTVADP